MRHKISIDNFKARRVELILASEISRKETKQLKLVVFVQPKDMTFEVFHNEELYFIGSDLNKAIEEYNKW